MRQPTKLHTADEFRLLAEHHMRMADRSGHAFTILLIRVDEANADRNVEAAGAAGVLVQATRESDVLARVGDGRYCVLLTGDAGGREAMILSRLVEEIAAHNARSGAGRLALSVGAAAYEPKLPAPLDAVLDEAERRMTQRG